MVGNPFRDRLGELSVPRIAAAVVLVALVCAACVLARTGHAESADTDAAGVDDTRYIVRADVATSDGDAGEPAARDADVPEDPPPPEDVTKPSADEAGTSQEAVAPATETTAAPAPATPTPAATTAVASAPATVSPAAETTATPVTDVVAEQPQQVALGDPTALASLMPPGIAERISAQFLASGVVGAEAAWTYGAEAAGDGTWRLTAFVETPDELWAYALAYDEDLGLLCFEEGGA